MDDTKIIITMGDLIAIHSNLMQITVHGEETMILSDTIKGIRGIMQNPVVFNERIPPNAEATEEPEEVSKDE